MKINKAVIPVAGLGTRFLPITKVIPKELLPVVNKPVIQYVVEEAVSAGIEEIILVISPEKQIIGKYFSSSPRLEAKLKKDHKLAILKEIKALSNLAKFSFAIQKEPLGTGHALLCAKRHVTGENFAYFDGDAIFDFKVPVIKQVIDIFHKYSASGAVGGIRVERKSVSRYGNLDVKKLPGLEREFKLKAIIEKPKIEDAPRHNLVVSGQRYVFSPKIFDYLKTQQPGVGKEIWLADAASRLAAEGNFYACELEGKYHDTGNILEYLKTNLDFGLKDPQISSSLKKYLRGVS